LADTQSYILGSIILVIILTFFTITVSKGGRIR